MQPLHSAARRSFVGTAWAGWFSTLSQIATPRRLRHWLWYPALLPSGAGPGLPAPRRTAARPATLPVTILFSISEGDEPFSLCTVNGSCVALSLPPRFTHAMQGCSMKLSTLALAASFVLAGYAQAQTQEPSCQAPAPSQSQPSQSTPAKHPLSKSCKSEVHKLCGSTHGDAMKSCVHDNLDQNKFSADCTTELKAQMPAKPGS
jgi:hypothetical protein